MALIGLIGIFTASVLPESLGRNLPETAEGANNFGKDDKFWSLASTQKHRHNNCPSVSIKRKSKLVTAVLEL